MFDDPEDLAILAHNVRQLRQHRGWSQQYLADACRIDRTTVIKIERGDHHPSFITIILLARALEKPLWALLFTPEACSSTAMLLRGLFERASAPARKAILALAKRLTQTHESTT